VIAEQEARRRAQMDIDAARAEYPDCEICAQGFDGPELSHRHIGPVAVSVYAGGRIFVGTEEISVSDATRLAGWLDAVAANWRAVTAALSMAEHVALVCDECGGSMGTVRAPAPTMPLRCSDCRKGRRP
jgi:hypothetical protein